MSSVSKFPSLFSRAIVGCILIAAAWGLRAPFLERKEWNLDEGSTFTMAQQILAGDVLYRDAVDNRAPLVPYLKAAVFAVFGDWNVHAVHVLLALCLGAVAFLLWDLCRRLGERDTGSAAAACFTLLSFLLPGSDALAAHTEWFVVIFSSLGFWIFAAGIAHGGFGRGLLVGLCFGASALCKQPGLLDGGVVGVCALVLALRATPDERRRLLALCSGMIAGVFILLAVTLLFFWQHHALRDLIYYVWTYNSKIYVPAVPLQERLRAGRLLYDLAADHAPSLGVLAASGLVLILVQSARRKSAVPRSLLTWLIIGWIGTGVLATMLSGRSFTHYSIQAIPGLSLAAGWLLARLVRVGISRPKGGWLPRVAALAGVGAIAVWVGYDAIRGWRSLEPREDAHEERLFSLVRQSTPPTERIFVWGYYPTLYLMTERLPSSRFIYTNYLTGLIPWTNIDPLTDTHASEVPGGWEKLAEDLIVKPPALIVDTVSMRGYLKYPLSHQPLLWSLIVKDYAQVSVGDPDTRGLRLFRRVDRAPQSLRAGLPLDLSIALSGYQSLRQSEPPALHVKSERHAQRIDLFAGDTFIESVPLASEKSVDVILFPPASALSGSCRVVLATAEHSVISTAFDFARFVEVSSHQEILGPRLHLGSTTLNPTKVETLFAPVEHRGDRWRVSAPADLEYLCPVNVEKISFTHQVVDPHSMLSDGYDVLAEFIDPKGQRTRLYLDRLQPRTIGKDQMRRGARFTLPPGHPEGRLVLRFLNGAENNPNADLIDMSDLYARDIGPSITLGSNRYEPAFAESAEHEAMNEDIEGHWSADTPAVVEWVRPLGLEALSLHYGIREGAYTSTQGHSDGVEFSVAFRDESGSIQPLFTQLLTPYNHLEHRGEQVARVELPPNRTGTIILTAGPGPANDRTWDWAWVGPIQGHAKSPMPVRPR